MYGVQKLDAEERLLDTYGDAAGDPFDTRLGALEAAEALEEAGDGSETYRPVELSDPPPNLTPLPS